MPYSGLDVAKPMPWWPWTWDGKGVSEVREEWVNGEAEEGAGYHGGVEGDWRCVEERDGED